MKRFLTSFCCLTVLVLVAAFVPAHAATAKQGTATNAGIAHPVGDIVALAPNPTVYQPNSVKCPQTMCVPVFHGVPEFDPTWEGGIEGGGFGGWWNECVYVQGSSTRCLNNDGGPCTATVSCDGLSY